MQNIHYAIVNNEIAKICKNKINKAFTEDDYNKVLELLELENKYVNKLLNEILEEKYIK